MNRENYLINRDKGAFDIDSLYEYWSNNKKNIYKNLNINEFESLIKIYLNNNGNISLNKLWEYFDKKYNIVFLFDKNNTIIKKY